MSVMSQHYSVLIYQGIIAPGHIKELVDGLNVIDKRHIYKLLSNVKVHGSKLFDSYMQIHTSTQDNVVSLTKEYQQHMFEEHPKHYVIEQGIKKYPVKENRQTETIMFRIMLTLRTKM